MYVLAPTRVATLVSCVYIIPCTHNGSGHATCNVLRMRQDYTSNKNIHFEMILDVGIGEKRKETRFLI